MRLRSFRAVKAVNLQTVQVITTEVGFGEAITCYVKRLDKIFQIGEEIITIFDVFVGIVGHIIVVFNGDDKRAHCILKGRPVAESQIFNDIGLNEVILLSLKALGVSVACLRTTLFMALGIISVVSG